MILCVNLFWSSKIICSLILMQNMFLGTKRLKTLFLEDLGWIHVFLKTFKFILMHLIHEICWFEWFLHKIFIVFQNCHFSRFSIDWCYFSTDQNCDKNVGLNLPGSIGARLILDRLNLFLDRSKLNFNWSKFKSWVL